MQIRVFVVAGVLMVAAAADSSAAWAAWGCAARNPADWWGNTFGYDTKEQASSAALSLCKQGDCRIVGCNPNIDTSAQADSTWPPPSPKTRCIGAGC
jgi:hypothetical protein